MRINSKFLPVKPKSSSTEINPWNKISMKTHSVFYYIISKYDTLVSLDP